MNGLVFGFRVYTESFQHTCVLTLKQWISQPFDSQSVSVFVELKGAYKNSFSPLKVMLGLFVTVNYKKCWKKKKSHNNEIANFFRKFRTWLLNDLFGKLLKLSWKLKTLGCNKHCFLNEKPFGVLEDVHLIPKKRNRRTLLFCDLRFRSWIFNFHVESFLYQGIQISSA